EADLFGERRVCFQAATVKVFQRISTPLPASFGAVPGELRKKADGLPALRGGDLNRGSRAGDRPDPLAEHAWRRQRVREARRDPAGVSSGCPARHVNGIEDSHVDTAAM